MGPDPELRVAVGAVITPSRMMPPRQRAVATSGPTREPSLLPRASSSLCRAGECRHRAMFHLALRHGRSCGGEGVGSPRKLSHGGFGSWLREDVVPLFYASFPFLNRSIFCSALRIQAVLYGRWIGSAMGRLVFLTATQPTQAARRRGVVLRVALSPPRCHAVVRMPVPAKARPTPRPSVSSPST